MARGARLKPKRLAQKLVQIRTRLGLSQNELIRELQVDLTQNRISEYETDKGEPPLPVLLRYARLAGICVDLLIDDELDLPDKLPARPKHSRQ
ncbi:MAG: helix-turn-helix domain-containing protein [Acidobacteriota bacterium]|nr:helix-turn-helix domain-containing protein [Acidobacteriota bacterium]MDQ5836558.1 helix-turn-helix domain-containing protein [Acidobacteriota bacterium]